MELDVLVVGGGPIGALTALIFAEKSSKIRLIEQRSLNAIDAATKSRSLALNAMSLKILKQFDVLETIKPYLCPIKEVHISVKGHMGTSRIHAADHDLSALGVVIEQHVLEQALYARLQQAKIEVEDEASFDTIISGKPSSISYHQKNHLKQVSANYVIACDGQYSKVRQQLHVDQKEYDYQQIAWVMIFSIEKAHQFKAYEQFTDDGAVALLPMNDNKMTCIWTMPTASACTLESLTDEDFVQQLCQVSKRLASFKPQLLFKTNFELKTVLALKQAHENVLFLGNCAHALHPIAAQGFNLSLRDLNALYSLMKSEELGPDLFERFVGRTSPDQDSIFYYTHFLASFVGARFMPNWMKAMGLMVMEGVPSIKQRMSAFNLGCGL